jgi:poly-beta-1,6-N-acetyl-D-glucosamine N-deacetylase
MLKRWIKGWVLVICGSGLSCLMPTSKPLVSPAVSQATVHRCQTVTPPSTTALINGLTDIAKWTADPAIAANQAIGTLGPQIQALAAATPWPDLHERAKQAKVPIMMYHDITPKKEVFFDVTPDEFEQHLTLIRDHGLTPISFDQLVTHLQTGMPLPEKPILLTFDDGYKGQYDYAYKLLKKYGYPGAFSIYVKKIGQTAGRAGVTWDDLQRMAADPLVTIVSHSVSHPDDLRTLPDDKLSAELKDSKRILEEKLKISIPYFTYPTGFYDERVSQATADAGYKAALTMDAEDAAEGFAGESQSLLAIKRFGQSRLQEILPQASGGLRLPKWASGFDFTASVALSRLTIDAIPLILVSGGKPITIHAKSRYQVAEILEDSPAIAGVDGAFFSLEYLDSNVMIGPVLSQSTKKFLPGNKSENPRLNGRPLVLIGPNQVKFVPFQAKQHQTLPGIRAEMANVTDAFVGAAFLVRNYEPQPDKAFGNLFDFNAARDRAFWGINQSGQPVVGVTSEMVGSVQLGQMLAKAGLRDAVMLDSGASTSLAYRGESMMSYEPRPVPHVVGLIPPEGKQAAMNVKDASVTCTALR